MIFYIIPMKKGFNRFIASSRAKKVFLYLALLLILFFVFNDFLVPLYVKKGGMIEVPSVIGKKFSEAKSILDSVGLEGLKGSTRVDRDHPAGIVIFQNPSPTSMVKGGRRIYLIINEEEKLVSVPHLRGITVREGRFVLEREGLRLGTVEYKLSDEFPPNTICDQNVNPGSKLKRDSFVSVVVSQGTTEQKISVPDLKGKSLSEAIKILAQTGLKLGFVKYLPSVELLPNTVLDQFPAVGELVKYGQTIDLFIVQGGEKTKNYFEN